MESNVIAIDELNSVLNNSPIPVPWFQFWFWFLAGSLVPLFLGSGSLVLVLFLVAVPVPVLVLVPVPVLVPWFWFPSLSSLVPVPQFRFPGSDSGSLVLVPWFLLQWKTAPILTGVAN